MADRPKGWVDRLGVRQKGGVLKFPGCEPGQSGPQPDLQPALPVDLVVGQVRENIPVIQLHLHPDDSDRGLDGVEDDFPPTSRASRESLANAGEPVGFHEGERILVRSLFDVAKQAEAIQTAIGGPAESSPDKGGKFLGLSFYDRRVAGREVDVSHRMLDRAVFLRGGGVLDDFHVKTPPFVLSVDGRVAWTLSLPSTLKAIVAGRVTQLTYDLSGDAKADMQRFSTLLAGDGGFDEAFEITGFEVRDFEVVPWPCSEEHTQQIKNQWGVNLFGDNIEVEFNMDENLDAEVKIFPIVEGRRLQIVFKGYIGRHSFDQQLIEAIFDRGLLIQLQDIAMNVASYKSMSLFSKVLSSVSDKLSSWLSF